MSKNITCRRIIGDINIVNFLQAKCTSEYDLNDAVKGVGGINSGKIFLPMVINYRLYMLLNAGIECFSREPLKEDEIYLFDSGVKNTKDISYINKSLQEGKLVTIKLKVLAGFYYTVERNYDLRIITTYLYEKYYPQLPIVSIRPMPDGEFELVRPGIIIPNSLTLFMPLTAIALNEGLAHMNTTKKIRYEIFHIILVMGENFKYELFHNEDFIYINRFVKINDVQLKEGASRENYAVFCRNFFEKEFSQYIAMNISMKITNSAAFKSCKQTKKIPPIKMIDTVFKFGDNLIKRDDPEFFQIEKNMRNLNYVMSSTTVYNTQEDGNEEVTIIEVFPSEEFFGKPLSRRKKIEIVEIPLLSKEEAEKNAQDLIKEEEKESAKKESKKNKRKQKQKQKKKLSEKTAEIEPEKIPIASSDDDDFLDISFTESPAIEKEQSILPDFFPTPSDELLCDLEESFENKDDESIPDLSTFEEDTNNSQEETRDINSETQPDDNSYCDLHSDEFFRRIKEWDLSQFIPEIFCIPKNELISMFSKRDPDPMPDWKFLLHL